MRWGKLPSQKKLRQVKPGWKVLYRVGTPERCRWNGVLQYFATQKQAQAAARKLARSGHLVVVMDQRSFNEHGAPVGWERPFDGSGGTVNEAGWWIKDLGIVPDGTKIVMRPRLVRG